jgi:hypothetical protein
MQVSFYNVLKFYVRMFVPTIHTSERQLLRQTSCCGVKQAMLEGQKERKKVFCLFV